MDCFKDRSACKNAIIIIIPNSNREFSNYW